MDTIYIREDSGSDLDDVLAVERLAFSKDYEAKLVRNLLRDSSVKPILSLLAFQSDRPVGHNLIYQDKFLFFAGSNAERAE
ncbi:MAG: hypothetical protein AAF298_09665 [Cyanobacteria bacterium P01_A01_bin.40]